MLSTAKSAIVGFRPVVQLFARPRKPANASRAENSFYKFQRKLLIIVRVNNVYTNIRV